MTLPRATLEWALETFPSGRLGVVSALGPGTLMLIHLLSDLGETVPIVFIDTLYHFPETLDLVERVRSRYEADLRVIRPAESREAFEAEHGSQLWERDLERYQQLTKVAPFQQAIRG